MIALANELLQLFDKIFGLHPGFRPAHAKGVMLTGMFTPTEHAKSLTNAPHAVRASTPVTVRFSNFTGLPMIPDNVPEANPRGMAVRFNLAEHVHTDLVMHSTDSFPTRDGNGFLEFLKALAVSGPDVPSPKPIETFVGTHPATLTFVQIPKPHPVSFAKDTFYSVSAFQFKNAEGKTSFGRVRVVPEGGTEFVKDDEVAGLSATFLFDELTERVKTGPFRMKILVQMAAEGDPIDDATVRWPENRSLLDFGTLEIDKFVPDNPAEQKHIIFDPIPRVERIEATADPLFELRAAIYLISGRRRRAATLESSCELLNS